MIRRYEPPRGAYLNNWNGGREAGNGDEVLRSACAQGFDLIVLDVDLPGMSGDELCRKREQISPTFYHMLSSRNGERSGLPDLNQAPMTIFLNGQLA
ncbi:response regulator [Rhodococcus hoagii]|nr:response regulator [Prescottella equi]